MPTSGIKFLRKFMKILFLCWYSIKNTILLVMFFFVVISFILEMLHYCMIVLWPCRMAGRGMSGWAEGGRVWRVCNTAYCARPACWRALCRMASRPRWSFVVCTIAWVGHGRAVLWWALPCIVGSGWARRRRPCTKFCKLHDSKRFFPWEIIL